ncbi:MAG: HigA family addiction module antitoxin [Woeseia sp.]
MPNIRPTTAHPGTILLEEFMKPRGLSQNKLARDIGVPPRRINEIVHGNRSITPDTDLRLCNHFGLSDGFWLRLQSNHDLAKTKEARLDKTQRFADLYCSAVAMRLAEEPDRVIRLAEHNIGNWRQHNTSAPSLIEAWEKILSLPQNLLVELLTGGGPEMAELRRNNPFAGAVPEEERNRLVKYSWHVA